MRARKLTAALAAIPLMFAAVASPAAADNIQDSIQSNGAVTLEAGSTVAGKATIRVVHTGGDNDAGCNMDPGESPLILDILTPVGVTASPDPLSITNCGADYEVSFTAGANAVSGTALVSILSRPAADDSTKTAEFTNQVSIPITITAPAPSNTKPVVELTGVTDGATYDVGSTLDPVCNISDVEDGNSTKPATVTGTLSNGLGSQTATCDYTDKGGLAADMESATYSFVDTTGPTITHSLATTGQKVDDWYNGPVTVTFECSDPNGSGIASCLAEGETGSSKTLGEGAAQSVDGTATDFAGNSATDTASGINVDLSGPQVSYDGFVSGDEGDNGWYTSPVTVRFTATDQLSGPSSQSQNMTSDAEGDSVMLQSPAFSDAVGNSSTAGAAQSPGFKIDTQAPEAPTATLDREATWEEWHNGDVKVTFTADDLGSSGIAGCTVTPLTDEGVHTVSGTCTDNAGNVSATTEVTVKIDKSGPVILDTVTVEGDLGENDWYTSAVTVTFTAEDLLSGLTTPTKQVTSVGEGEAVQVRSPEFTDKVGNTTPAGQVIKSFKIDTQAPNAPTVLLDRIANGAGWHNQDVKVSFVSAGDNGASDGVHCTDDVTVTAEEAAQVISGTCTDAAGNESEPATVVINLDKSAPVVSDTVDIDGTSGTNGWYTSGITVTFTAEDRLSGLDQDTAKATSAGEGDAVTVASPVFTDRAGNSTPEGAVTREFKIDTQAPNAPTILLNPTANGAGWHNQNVKVSFVGKDNGASGVADCTDDIIVSAEEAGQAVSGTCTDNAGNESMPATVVINLDKTAPVVSEVVAIDGTEGADGWYTSDVDVAFSATDALSGLATDTKSVAVTQEGVHQVSSPAFTDTAGNTTAAGASGTTVKIDKTAPSEPTFTGLPEGSFYFGNTVLMPKCAAEDTLSGATCDVTLGKAGDDLNAVGTHTFIATATNGAGLTSTSSFTYTVLAWTAKGFYSPVDMGGTWNTVKGGSTVPLKFEVFKGAQELSDTTSVRHFSTKPAICPGASAPADAIEFLTTGGTALRWDSTAGQFIQNWQTPKKPGTCHAVTVTLQDGSSLTANFILK